MLVNKIINRFRYQVLLLGFNSGRIFGRSKNYNFATSDTLTVFWDLETQDITFMIIPFLVFCEIQCQTLGKKNFRLIIVPTVKGGVKKLVVWKEYADIYDESARESRLFRIVLSASTLIGKCQGVHVCGSRDEAKWFENGQVIPHEYSSSYPKVFDVGVAYSFFRQFEFEGVKACANDLRIAEEILRSLGIYNSFICISLRKQKYDSVRNSDYSELAKFVKYLNSEGCPVVAIPDFDCIHEKLELGCPLITSASVDLGLRTAFVQLAAMNIMPNGGVANVAQFMVASNFIVYHFLPPNAEANHPDPVTDRLRRDLGLGFESNTQIYRLEELCFDLLKSDYDNYFKSWSHRPGKFSTRIS